MAGKYSDICLIPSWTQIGREESKKIVIESAKKNSRENKISFASLSFSREGYDRTEAIKLVSAAKNEGSEYYIMGFPRKGYLEAMKDFAKEVMPSFS